jgi:DeoR family ulaG and ulaABCDEF operon transcriptional repressor
MFMGAQGIGPLGLMEADPLLVQSETKLISQADELVVLVDSTKFDTRSSLILCGLERISTLITDEGISDKAASVLAAADVKLIVVQAGSGQDEEVA